MQEALDTILEAEKAARARLEEASRKAEETRAEADARAEAIISEARASAALDIKRRVAEARRLAEERLAAGRAEIALKNNAFYSSLEAASGELARAAALVALRTDLEP
ncbi:MAG TPA: hypothetical protein VIO60_02620 [Rectinemataceae bacterium]